MLDKEQETKKENERQLILKMYILWLQLGLCNLWNIAELQVLYSRCFLKGGDKSCLPIVNSVILKHIFLKNCKIYSH
jgi:hypothetical protein